MEFNRTHDGWHSAGAGHGQGTALTALFTCLTSFFLLYLCFPMLLPLQRTSIPPFPPRNLLAKFLPRNLHCQSFAKMLVPCIPQYIPPPRAVIPSPDCKVLSSWSMVLDVTLSPWGWGFLGSRWFSSGVIGVLPPALLPLCSFIWSPWTGFCVEPGSSPAGCYLGSLSCCWLPLFLSGGADELLSHPLWQHMPNIGWGRMKFNPEKWRSHVRACTAQ